MQYTDLPYVTNGYLRHLEHAEKYIYVGESRNYDRLNLMQISKRFADIYRFYSMGLATTYCGKSDVAKNRTSLQTHELMSVYFLLC